MEKNWEKAQREERFRHVRANPSFSSTLLDVIYRSIDEGEGEEEEEELVIYRESMRKKQSSNVRVSSVLPEEEMANLRRACLIEKWMEKKKVNEKVVVRPKSSPPDFDFNNRNSLLFNSTSCSSDSSCGGGFSSSEAESVYGSRSRSRSRSSSGLKPIRTAIPEQQQKQWKLNDSETQVSQQKPKQESGFTKTKSRALKIYGDLKKVKQPISPGGRLSSFLNSLFTAGNLKKSKVSSSSSSSVQASTPCSSSASSFSRSCLSKTPSSRGKLSNNNGMKRTVRFYPVSEIVDEDCRPCGHKSLYEDEPNKELQFHLMEKNRRVEEAARDLLKGYHKCDFDMREDIHDDDEDDDDDVASCSSSDLFELDNLSGIGIERYREELPVYETTHVVTNRAIANGLIL